MKKLLPKPHLAKWKASNGVPSMAAASTSASRAYRLPSHPWESCVSEHLSNRNRGRVLNAALTCVLNRANTTSSSSNAKVKKTVCIWMSIPNRWVSEWVRVGNLFDVGVWRGCFEMFAVYLCLFTFSLLLLFSFSLYPLTAKSHQTHAGNGLDIWRRFSNGWSFPRSLQSRLFNDGKCCTGHDCLSPGTIG